MELGLRGRTAVVTGASMGIGLAIARALAAEGVELTIAARSADRLRQHADALAEAYGVTVHPYAADLSSAEAVAELAAFAFERLGRADILVNNAGAIPGGPIDSLDDETWQRAYDLKLWGYLRLSKALLPGMKAHGRGVIINIIGNAGKRPTAGYIAGGIANAGLMNFTAALAQDAGPFGVRVVAINPGPTRTERMEQLLQRQSIDRRIPLDELRANAARDIPLRRVAEAEDVANLAAFLASDRAAMITGCTIPVEGGATASL